MLGRLVTMLVSALMFTLIGTGAVPANAVNIGQEGCTPGYWKTHTENWQEARPDGLFSAKFSDGTSGVLVGVTLEQALAGGGGPGVAGAERILARAATAAYLNAAHEGLGFPGAASPKVWTVVPRWLRPSSPLSSPETAP